MVTLVYSVYVFSTYIGYLRSSRNKGKTIKALIFYDLAAGNAVPVIRAHILETFQPILPFGYINLLLQYMYRVRNKSPTFLYVTRFIYKLDKRISNL